MRVSGSKSSPVFVADQARIVTSYQEIAGFLRRIYGIEHPIVSLIRSFDGLAGKVVSLDPQASFDETTRQVILYNDRLWLARPVEDPGKTLRFTQTMKTLGFNLPALAFLRSRGRVLALQEYLVRAKPPFVKEELKELESRTLPAVLAAQGAEPLDHLNLTLEKFLTVGSKKYFIGLRPRSRPASLDFIAYQLLRAGLIDPRRGIEQFEEGLRALKALGQEGFEIKSRLSVLLEAAKEAWRWHQDELIFREKHMMPKTMLVPEQLIPHIRPEGLEAVEPDIISEIKSKIANGQIIDMEHLVDEIVSRKTRIIRIEGGTASGKSTFSPELVETLAARGLKVFYVGVDDIALKPPEERQPLKQTVAELAGLGFICRGDEALSFDSSKLKEFIERLDFSRRRTFTIETRHRKASAGGGYHYESQIREVVLDTDTVVILEGKFQSHAHLWENQKEKPFTIFLQVPQDVALERIRKRVNSQALEQEVDLLFEAFYEPSYYAYMQESGLLGQVDVIVRTNGNKIYSVSANPHYKK